MGISDNSWVDALSFPLAFFMLTFVQILFGELVPKNIAIRNPLKYTLLIAWPLKVFYIIFHPFIWLLQASSSAILQFM